MLFLPDVNYNEEIILSEKDIREANLTFAEAILFDDFMEIHELAMINNFYKK